MTVNKFAKFEKENNMFSRTYNGFPYWQYIRFDIAYSLIAEERFAKTRKKNHVFRNKCKKIFLSMIMFIENMILFPFIRRCEILCLLCCTKNLPHPIFYDYWKKPASISFFSMNEFGDPGVLCLTKHFPNTVIPASVAKLKYIVKKMTCKSQNDSEETTILKELLTQLDKNVFDGQALDAFERQIIKSKYIDQEYEKYWRKIFSKTGCKAITIVCYYSVELFSAIRVAKEMGIRVVEFQHGTIADHVPYFFEDKNEINNSVPDYMLVFGDLQMKWTKLMGCTRAIPTGYPFHDVQLREIEGVETEDDMIIIYPFPDKKFEEKMDEFIDLAVKKGYKVVIKIHPKECKDVEVLYPVLSKNKYATLITHTEKSIYYWLKKGRHHVMMFSTVGLEACSFGHCNICLGSFSNIQPLQFLLDYGYARQFQTVDELMALIEYPMMINKDMRDRIYKSNAEQNVPHFFEELKRQGWPTSKDFIWNEEWLDEKTY